MTTDEDYSERRKYARLETVSQISYRVTDSCKRKVKVPCLNISIGGA